MSSRVFLTSAGASARQSLLAASGVASRRTIAQTASLRLKESSSQDPNPDEFEKHKQDQLKKQKEGRNHWKPELASNSEEAIKADRMSPGEANEAAMRELQDRTKQTAEDLQKHGTSMKDGL